MFHTVTDWYSACVSSRVTEIDCNGESAHSLWLDLDSTKTARLLEVVSLLNCLC
ncbi:hypothetical protein Bca4012_010663 [Brassica carinata]|uniref:Uncharacterized protein n=1 Tax=Brassica carinata TaxID=52824 RepID=A0A8X7S2Y2_BRACI|nr:hypothetical protein Bca52824_035577 [Brassica carinata]